MGQGGEKLRNIRKKKGISQKVLYHLTGISASSISRIENDRKIPSNDEIALLAYGVRTNKEFLQGFFDLDREYRSKQKTFLYSYIPIPVSDGVDFSRHIRKVIAGNRAKGMVSKALFDIQWLEERINYWILKVSNTKALESLLTEKAYILWEKVICYSDTNTPEAAWRNIKPIINQLKEINDLVKSDETRSMLKFIYQGLYYLSKENKKAIHQRITEYSVISEPFLQLAIHRVYGSCLGYLGHYKDAESEISNILSLIDKGKIKDPFTIMWGMDAIGRVYALEKNPSTCKHFEKSWAILDAIEKQHGRSRLREVQLALNNLRAVLHLDPTNLSYAEILAQRGFSAVKSTNSNEASYPRHEMEIVRIMNEIKNN